MTRVRDVWLVFLLVTMVAAALISTGCSSSGDGGSGGNAAGDSDGGDSEDDGTDDGDGESTFGDERTDAELLEVMQAALEEALAADGGFATLSTLDGDIAQELALLIQTQTLLRVTYGIANSSAGLREQSTAAEDPDEPVSGSATVLDIDYSGDCQLAGTAEEVGAYGTVAEDSTSTFQYGVDVSMSGCDDDLGLVVYGDTRYSGEYSQSGETGSLDYEYSINVNGGVAVTYDSSYYAFIVRDALSYSGTGIDETNTGDWSYDLSLRVDDQTDNWVCTYEADVTEGDYSTFVYDCASTASEL